MSAVGPPPPVDTGDDPELVQANEQSSFRAPPQKGKHDPRIKNIASILGAPSLPPSGGDITINTADEFSLLQSRVVKDAPITRKKEEALEGAPQ